MELNIFTPDELICLYDCIDKKISEMQLYSLPNTLKDYFNQLTHIQSLIHKEICRREEEFKNEIQK